MNNIEIYTLAHCPYSSKAKELLTRHRLHYNEHNISHDESNLRKELGNRFNIEGSITVPQITINGTYIGGYSELRNLFINGRIKEYLY